MKYTLFAILAVSLMASGCSLSQSLPSTDVDNKQPTPASEESPANPPANETLKTNTSLDLSNQNVEKIPEYVFGLKNLEELNVSNNQLTGAIQAEIRHLVNLKVLNASNNQMTGVPAEIGQLRNLEVLNLSNNQLTGLPYELGNLKNLKTLDISGNNYSEADLAIIKEALPPNVTIIQ